MVSRQTEAVLLLKVLCGCHAGWNILDGAVVAMGYVDVLMSGSSVTALRAVRVLRPLRTITHIKGLRVGTHQLHPQAACVYICQQQKISSGAAAHQPWHATAAAQWQPSLAKMATTSVVVHWCSSK
jgi:hypothetical protein